MTLHAPYDASNIFNKILRGEMPCVKVFEDEVALALMDVFPQVEGHTLVIPKQVEARNFLDMPEAKLGDYMLRVQKVTRAVEAGLKPDGIRVIQFNGAPAGQTVYHLHFHIMPIFDGVKPGAHASGGMKSAADLEPVAARIRAGF
ncbi:MAG: HIT family protein [Hyphomonas sp.]|uniref:HIT family protein n=1 Tax=Hyphomonas sp. TaxID=87 RepID=UPI00184CB412|nr:HIT family protein [Hyphomonas sp.]MBA3070046.1 HIT family protein [Hyphomonas sp.]MBU3920367.1 HIT family protein [Alphaproteobacteria bacterium]MBU4060378.1 HIT family protein [Alphaproteobacteria bacterium]MBU4163046.1 HIT family protein [Alphaproteobacteria bacterium]